MKQLFTSPKYKHTMMIVGSLVFLLVVFQTGIFVGFHKARMGLHADERYQRSYGEHFTNGPLGFPQDDFPEAHGAFGRVLSVHLPTIVVEDKDSEKVVYIATNTVVRKNHTRVEASTIMPNDFVIAIGSPNEKQEVQATLIRMIPPPPNFSSTTVVRFSSTTH